MASDSCVSIIIFLCSAVNLTDKIVHTLMQQRNGKAHFNRAVLEGIAYSMKDCYELLKNLGIAPKKLRSSEEEQKAFSGDRFSATCWV